MTPSAPGRVQFAEVESVSGALNDSENVAELSLKISRLAVVPLELFTCTLPFDVTPPEVMLPVVFMTVEPVINEALAIVPLLISGDVKVLLVNVSVAARVAMMPDVG